MGRNRFLMVILDLTPLYLTPAAIIWYMQNGTQIVEPGTTVRFHVVDIGAFGQFQVWIEDHSMTVIDVDGIDFAPYTTDGIVG